jgi:hypothetical protein
VLAPAVAQQHPATQIRGFEADQQGDQRHHEKSCARPHAGEAQPDRYGRQEDQVGNENQPQPPPQHPQRCQQECAPGETVGHEHDVFGARRPVAAIRGRLEHHVGRHGWTSIRVAR